jgi:molybdopterin-guanine dinucleotide biosynthesis protein A
MSPASGPIEWTALVLTGGRGSRLGNDDKAAMTIGGTSALDHLLSALPGRVPVVVAGPKCHTGRPVTFRQEQPVHAGPVAGIAAGLEAVSTPVVAFLGVDMPRAGALVMRLVAEFASSDAAALVPVDASGFRQPLCAVVRTEAVRAALRRLGDPRGRSMRDLMSLIDVRERSLDEAETRWVDDIDTPQDLLKMRSAAYEEGAQIMMAGWIDAVCVNLNLPAEVNVDVVLDVARAAAHSVERPAAPVTAYLLGLAVAGGMDVREAAARIQLLAAAWPAPSE